MTEELLIKGRFDPSGVTSGISAAEREFQKLTALMDQVSPTDFMEGVRLDLEGEHLETV